MRVQIRVSSFYTVRHVQRLTHHVVAPLADKYTLLDVV